MDNNGQLYIANTQATGSLNARNFNINGGVLGLTHLPEHLQHHAGGAGQPPARPSVLHRPDRTAVRQLHFLRHHGGQHRQSHAAGHHPDQRPDRHRCGPGHQNIDLCPRPFRSCLNRPPKALPSPRRWRWAPPDGNQTLTLTLMPRSTGANNADGTAGLNLSGAALQLFPNTAAALANDPELGAAIASSLTVYNNTNGISQRHQHRRLAGKAQQIFSQFAPDVSGGARQVAIMITDQATGPVAARQRLLRSYGNRHGEMTLWGEEFAGMINNKGRFDGEGDLTTYKDHGFGFSLGMDAGSARGGWYGGALTFYSSDVIETLPRQSKTNLQWYMLTGYTDWRGKHVFFDTKLDVGYGNLDGKRSLHHRRPGPHRRGQARRPAGRPGRHHRACSSIMAAFDVIPHISLDGMTHARGGLYRGRRRRRLGSAGRALLRQFAAHLPGRGRQEQL